MKKILSMIFKILIILAIIAWVAIIFVDYFKVTSTGEPIFCIKEDTKTYDDGTVYVCTGLGYKMYRYDRKSISAVEFGPFFIQERNN